VDTEPPALPLASIEKWAEAAPREWGDDAKEKLLRLARLSGVRVASPVVRTPPVTRVSQPPWYQPHTSTQQGASLAELDSELMQRYREGEVRAFELLLARHRGPVHRFILHFVNDQDLAEDLLQETFLRIIKDSGSYEPGTKFSTWIYRIAHNLCVGAVRRGRLRGAAANLEDIADDERFPSPQAAPDEVLMIHQMSDRVARAMPQLSGEQREVFLMREVVDLSFAEIAETLGMRQEAIKALMRDALEKLRDVLTADEAREFAARKSSA
jgi:RNA polymerase sigma-70 factor (ECF subfamily)